MPKKKASKRQRYRRIWVWVVLALVVVAVGAGFAARRLVDQSSVAAGKAPVTIVAVGDISCQPDNPFYNDDEGSHGACQSKATSDLALSLNPAAALILGDEQYRSGTLNDFQDSYDKTWGRLKSISRPVPGNHEYQNLGASGYYNYFGTAAGIPEVGYYSFNVGTWHVVALNANCKQVGGCEKGSAQERWLRHDLADHGRPCTLAFWHQPRFSSGKNGNDAAYQPFWQDLQDYGADVVLNGHDHDYERFAPQAADGAADPSGPTEFVVGTGGESLTQLKVRRANSLVWDNRDYGVLQMTLDNGSYSWKFITESGAVKDARQANCVSRP